MTAPEPEIPVRLVQLWLCDPCLDGAGGECHTPGCALWINRAPDLPLRNSPMVTIVDTAPGAAGMTPGQAVYEAHHAYLRRCFPGIALIGWDELSPEAQAEWEGIAQSGVAAYIEANGRDPVDAVSVITEAVVPELTALLADRNQLREFVRRVSLGTAGPPHAASVAADEVLTVSREYREQWQVLEQ